MAGSASFWFTVHVSGEIFSRVNSITPLPPSPPSPIDDRILPPTEALVAAESGGGTPHLARTADAHPEALFLELSRLAGALCTFALDAHPRQLPAYDHDALGPTFDTLERMLRARLEVVLPASALRVPMERTRQTLFTARVADERAFRRARWLLEVRAGLVERELVRQVPALIKLGAAADIAQIVQQALPALSLTHLPVPPPAVSPRSDAVYFVVAQEGSRWANLTDSREVAAYVPDAIPDAELALCLVFES